MSAGALSLISLLALAAAEPTPVPAPAPEEDILSQPSDGPMPAPTGVKDDGDIRFGEALSLLKLEASWSGYGDINFTWGPHTPSSFDASHFNPILLARVGDRLSAEAELEISAGSIGVEYVIADFLVVPGLTVRAGRFIIPIGQYNEVLHPSFRWNMVSKPLMFEEVVPSTWTGTGLQARGNMALAAGTRFEYALYAFNGLAENKGGAGTEAYEGGDGEVLASFRSNLPDNNSDKALGARVGFSLLGDQTYGATKIGFSAVSGAFDAAGLERASIVDVDLSIRLGALTLRGEAAQNYLGKGAEAFTPFEKGFYAQAIVRFDPFNVSARYDFAQERPGEGAPVNRRQAAASIGYAPNNLWGIRAEVALPLGADQPNSSPKLATMLNFSF